MRLFLALEVPAPLRSRIADLQSELRESCPGWRWVRPGGIHLTIRFLGEVDPAREAEIRPAWERAAASVRPFTLRPTGLGCFPNVRRPRVLHVRIELPP